MTKLFQLFLDDERMPVETELWVIVRSSNDAMRAVVANGMVLPNHIAFDHDLGGDDTSIRFIDWITDALIDERMSFPEEFSYSIHSQNPVGVVNIRCRMEQILRHFYNKENDGTV